MCFRSLVAECETSDHDEPQSDIIYCSPADKGSYTDALALVSPTTARSRLRQLRTTSGGQDSSRTPPGDACNCSENQCLTSSGVLSKEVCGSRFAWCPAMAVVWTRTHGRRAVFDG